MLNRFVWIWVCGLGLGMLSMLAGCQEQGAARPSGEVDSAFVALSSEALPSGIPDFAVAKRPEIVQSRWVQLNMPYFQAMGKDGKDSVVRLNFMPEKVLDVVCDSVVVHSDSLFSWWGRLKGAESSTANIVVSKTSMFMNIQAGATVYEALTFNQSVTQLNWIDQLKFGDLEDVAQVPDTNLNLEVDPGPISSGPSPVFTVLVLLSKPLHAMCGDIALEQSFENSLNFVLGRFGMTGFRSDVIMTCTEIVPQGGNLDADLSTLKNDTIVKLMRNLAKADLVSMMVPDGTVGGVAAGVDIPITNQSAVIHAQRNCYNVVRFRNAIADFSFAHEVGHGFGMGHARPAGQVGLPGCNWASRFPVVTTDGSGEARSVMAHASFCPTCPREGVYSNPQTITQNGITFGPMGHACNVPANGADEPRDNLQILIESFPFVCRYR